MAFSSRRARSRLGRQLGWVLTTTLVLAVLLLAAGLFVSTLGLVDLEPWLPGISTPETFVGLEALGSGLGRLAVMFGSAVVGMVATALLAQQLAPPAKAGQTYVLSSDEQGLITVELDGIRTIAVAALLPIAGVLDADVDVDSRGGGPIRMRTKLDVLAGSDLPKLGEQARGAAREAVETLVGVNVGDVTVEIHVVPPDVYVRGMQ